MLRLRSLLGDGRQALVAIAGSLGTALVLGVPTDVIPNPWFTRMSAVRPADYVFLFGTAALAGPLLATYLPRAGCPAGGFGGGTGGGLLGFLAIGCPLCNKIVVGAVGASGALTYFGPMQPLLGVAGLALSAAALRTRLRRMDASCPVPSGRPRPSR